MAARRNRLFVRLFHFIEGEAEGRFAISALVFVFLAAILLWLTYGKSGP